MHKAGIQDTLANSDSFKVLHTDKGQRKAADLVAGEQFGDARYRGGRMTVINKDGSISSAEKMKQNHNRGVNKAKRAAQKEAEERARKEADEKAKRLIKEKAEEVSEKIGKGGESWLKRAWESGALGKAGIIAVPTAVAAGTGYGIYRGSKKRKHKKAA